MKQYYKNHFSNYKDILSQPAEDLSHRQRLLWLQKRRTKGLWVQCDDCNKWRHLAHVLDKHELPSKWYCGMNQDKSIASCTAPEVPLRIHDEEDLIHSEYAAGSLVLARMAGWPWWPAMVDDCPDTEQYYWLDGFSDIPTHYNVVFFDAFEVTRAWMSPNQLKPYTENKKMLKSLLRRKKFNKRLQVAIEQADDAEKLSLSARLMKYSFIGRYKGIIASPKKINKNVMKKYQDRFKKKFNVELPSESDSDDEMNSKETNNKKKNMVILGKKSCSDYNDRNAVSDGKETSLLVEVDTNSELTKNALNETSSMNPDNTNQTNIVEDSQKSLQRAASTASDDFDF
ncbi:zinc finger CW-type PWWP domain protein 1-like [Melitaea cinxia]|uniref:zinc finger CW-type PWWP domain protein 1-like n=1 Tax=Melitaea cinxia TaxID=113334 RepID=UPI001E271F11|nr:zinc finger CW-type PWWP domain protein 1-like [Melitaea cinxia]